MKIFRLANFQTFFKKTCTNNPTSEIQIAPFLWFMIIGHLFWVMNSRKLLLTLTIFLAKHMKYRQTWLGPAEGSRHMC